MKIVSYYTEGPYAREAARLTRSMEIHKIAHLLDKQKIPRVDWFEATAYKPVFLKKMLIKHKCPILFVDADAIFHTSPVAFFEKLKNQNYHMALYRRNLWQTGTMWLDYAPEAMDVIDCWIAKNLEKRVLRNDRKGGGQQNFNEVVRDKRYHWFKKLPPKYCWFDILGPRPKDVVIEHLQASRELRQARVSSPGLRKKRKKRVADIEKHFGMGGK